MTNLTKSAKGVLSELAIAGYYVNQGWVVYTPFTHDTEIDLIVTKGPRFKRIQVKTVYLDGSILRANVHKDGSAKYSPDSVDLLAAVWYGGVHCSMEHRRTWLIPMEDIERETTLNFGKVNGDPSNTRGNFEHSKYEVKQ